MTPWAWLTKYEKLKSLGICTATARTNCREPATDGQLCDKHRAQHRIYSSNSQKRLYYARKVRGNCVECDAILPEDATSIQCVKCSKIGSARRRKARSKPRYKAHRRKMERRLRNERTEKGLCVACNGVLVTRLYCETHRRKMLDAWRAKAGNPKGRLHCRACGEAGHYATTCLQRPSVSDTATIEHYATARSSGESEMPG